MKSNQPKRIAISLVAAMGIAMASQAALAHGNADNKMGMGSGTVGQQQGQGMMNGVSPEMMGQQQGQGMMGGMNPGMMDGMGQGMMNGLNPEMMNSMGQGMMGSMSPGMMSGMGQSMMGGSNIADIDAESRAKINTEMDSLRLKSWEITGLALKEAPVLRDALSEELPDPAAVGAIYANLFDLKQQLIEAQLSTRNAIKGIVKNAAETETESKE